MRMKLLLPMVAALAAGAAQAQPQTLREAPALAARATRGEIPPVAQRVGAEPMVVRPHERVGRYGGTIRVALRGGGDHNAILRIVGNQGLVRWNLTMTDVEPNVAQSWEVSPDARQYTFRLRRGMRWSDGTPFTADDVVFSMNDMTLNREFYPATPGRFTVGGAPVRVEKLDDHTVRFTFAAPAGRLLQELAVPLGQHPTLFQRAYCSQFHPAYAPAERIAEQVRAGGFRDWAALMRSRCGDIEVPARWQNPQRPTLDPWVITEGYTGGATRVVMQRNPFFWQVDTEGNQLPYVDTIQFPIISDMETILLRAISGDLDLQVRHIDNVQNRPVLHENRERGRYELVELSSTSASTVAFYFNLTNRDPRLRELFRNREFRIAVSHAVNRQEIIDSVYLGQGVPYQVGPVPEHPLHNAQLGTQFLRHDPAEANRRLDAIGLTRRDAQRFRLWPDGRRVFFTIDAPVSNPDALDALALIKRDLAAVGIDIGINAVERALFYDRANRNEHDVGFTLAPGGLDPFEELRSIVAEHPLDSRQSLEWQKWYESGGRLGEEPTASMRRRFELLDRWRATADRAAADAIFREILQIAADEFEVVGIVRPRGSPGIRNRRLRNVPSPMINAWTFATPGSTLVQQYFYEQ
jgi:peptide/nickel transport system substrate-binding protein